MSEMPITEKVEKWKKLSEAHPILNKMVDVWLEYQSIFDLSHPESKGETQARFYKLERDVKEIEDFLKQGESK